MAFFYKSMTKILKEQLCLSSTNPIKVRDYDYKYFSYPWHFHSEFELIYVEKGEGQCLVGEGVLSYNNYSVLLMGSELPHCMKSPVIYEKDNDMRVKGVIIQFEKDFMRYSFSRYVQFVHIHNLLENAKRGFCVQLEKNSEVVTLLNTITKLEGLEQIICFLRLLETLSFQPHMEFASSFEYHSSFVQLKDKKIEKVISFLNRHYTSDISLDEVAAYIAMNKSAFCRYFKGKTGKTFKEYIMAMRISYACKLLVMNDMTISQIGQESGFESISNFNRYFKDVMKMSPKAYREKMS